MLAVASLLAFSSGTAALAEQAAPQFGVVQLGKLYQESQLGKLGMARAEELQKKAMAELQGLQEKLEKARADKKDDEAGKIEKELQSRVYFLQNVIKQDQEHIMAVLQSATKNAFDKYSEEHGLLGIFSAETMLSSAQSADITAQVLTLLDKEKADYGDLPSLEMPPLPEPANAGEAPSDSSAAEAAAK